MTNLHCRIGLIKYKQPRLVALPTRQQSETEKMFSNGIHHMQGKEILGGGYFILTADDGTIFDWCAVPETFHGHVIGSAALLWGDIMTAAQKASGPME